MEVRRGAGDLTSGRCSIPWPRLSGGSGAGCGWRGAGTEHTQNACRAAVGRLPAAATPRRRIWTRIPPAVVRTQRRTKPLCAPHAEAGSLTVTNSRGDEAPDRRIGAADICADYTSDGMQIDRIWAPSPVTRSREPGRGVLPAGGNGTGGGLLALVTLRGVVFDFAQPS